MGIEKDGLGAVVAAGQGDQPAVGQVVERRGAVDRLQRPELGDRASVDGDHDALPGTGPTNGAGHARAQLPDPDSVDHGVRALAPGRAATCTPVDTWRRAPRPGSRLDQRTESDTSITTPTGGPTVNFAFSEEQEELRKVVKDFLNNKSSEATVRELMDTEVGLRPRRLDPDGRADGPAGPGHPRGVRGIRVLVRRAHRRARGDGPTPAVRPLLLDRGAGGPHAAALR